MKNVDEYRIQGHQPIRDRGRDADCPLFGLDSVNDFVSEGKMT